MAERSTADRVRLFSMMARLSARAGRLDAENIKRAYRELAAILHPDRGGARADFEVLTEARNALLAQVARAVELRAGRPPPSLKPEPHGRLDHE
jgi:hypothetical protein